MKKAILILTAAIITLTSCNRNGFGCHGNSKIMTRVTKLTQKHKCKWELCPYKGVTLANYKEAITDYTGEPEGNPAHIVDCLHILHPSASYDQLAEMMEND
jgi:hypothetical protein